MLGAIFVSFSLARTTVDRGHIAVDFLVQRLPDRFQHAVEAVNAGICALLFTVVSRQCVIYALDLKASGEVSMTLQMPLFPFVFGIALGSAMLSAVLYVNCLSWSLKAFESSG
jgi:TRAP-type C4-dicarboxylate transport system permease small subunit